MDNDVRLLKPRLRLFRRSPSPRIAGDVQVHDEEDEFPTPRVPPKPIHADPGDTPAARLRALLAREPRSPRAMSPPSEADSVAGPPHLGSSTSSVARDSLKDIFSRALREPGDTPQKGRLRRNSFDGSSMEITPVVDRNGAQRRPSRRSLSDEEAEKPKGRWPDPSFRMSTALTFDALRARLASSRSQLMDQHPPEALYDPSTTTSESQTHPQTSQSTRVDPQVNSLTPYPSFQMSAQLASQSNLLEQDSEMQREMGDVLNSENEASTSAPVAQTTPVSFNPHSPSERSGSKNASKLEPSRSSFGSDPSMTPSAANGTIGGIHHSQHEERNHQREWEWNRPRLPSGSAIPETRHRHSQESHRRLSQEFRSPSHSKTFSHESVVSQSGAAWPVNRRVERRSSLASLRSFDDDRSSRPSSVSSQADYRERVSELERERNHEREREWNKRQPQSRPSSSLSTSSNHSFTHSHSHPPSAVPYLTPTHASLQRKSSRTSLRSDSPASLASSRDSLKEREEEDKKEVIHERERNWNSPHPHWSSSKSPSALLHRTRHNSLRASPSLTYLGSHDRHGDPSRVSPEPQSALPKASSFSATSPALLRKSGDHSRSGLESAASNNQSMQSKGSSPSRTPGTASKFGWNFARSPLPPLEFDDSPDHRKNSYSPSPSRTSVASHIPVWPRMKVSSAVHAASDMSLTNVIGNESSFGQGHQSTLDDVLDGHRGPLAAKYPWDQENTALGSDEEPNDDLPPHSTTPKSHPPTLLTEDTDADTEVLTSPSPHGSPQLGVSATDEASLQQLNNPPHDQTPDPSLQEPLPSATPPGTPPSASPGSQLPPSDASPSFALVTPPRQTSLGSSILDFRTPSPPHDLPDLPGPPLSSDDDALGGTPTRGRHVDANSNFTLTKTPKPPGAWAATPLPPQFDRRSPSPATLFPLESTPPAFTSTPLPRANSYPHTRTDTATDDPSEDSLLTPAATLSRARSLPLRTPAPPGAWVATPGQSVLLTNGADQTQFGSIGRKKGLLKVRFDVAESETSATEGHSNSPLTAIKLTNPELPLPKLTTEWSMDSDAEVVVNGVSQSAETMAAPRRPATPERPVTPTSRESGLSPRSLRKSPSVRLVDAYGRERVDERGNAQPLMVFPNGHADAERKTPTTPRTSLVRIVDAMGREVDDTVEAPDASRGEASRSFEADVSVTSDDTPIGHAEALARMRKTLRDLAESLSDTDRSEDLELNSSHLQQLEEVSKAARVARNQLAQNLQLETAKQHDLHHASKFSAWARGVLPVTTKKPWNTTIIYCAVLIQLLFVLAIWRYAHVEARRLFYITYYDPLYPEFTPIQGNSCFSGTIPTSRSWTMIDSYETIRREGWRSVGQEIYRAMRHVGDQAWERWGENVHFEKPT